METTENINIVEELRCLIDIRYKRKSRAEKIPSRYLKSATGMMLFAINKYLFNKFEENYDRSSKLVQT